MSKKFVHVCALVLFVLGLSGCGGHRSDTARTAAVAEQATAVMQVLLTMEKGLQQRDATALSALWEPGLRSEARARMAQAFAAAGAGRFDLTLELAGLRTFGERMLARVVWHGVRAGTEAAGQLQLEMAAGDPPLILALYGNDPVTGETIHPAGP